jgi:hypothetical protein
MMHLRFGKIYPPFHDVCDTWYMVHIRDGTSKTTVKYGEKNNIMPYHVPRSLYFTTIFSSFCWFSLSHPFSFSLHPWVPALSNANILYSIHFTYLQILRLLRSPMTWGHMSVPYWQACQYEQSDTSTQCPLCIILLQG